jgi:pilus assembly protein Flp/PilA
MRPARRFAFTANRFIRHEDGPTAVEYAVMLALVLVVVMTGVTLLSDKVNGIYENMAGIFGL